MILRRIRVHSALVLGAALVAGCGGDVVRDAAAPPAPPPGLATLQLVIEPGDVEVAVDDAFAGVLTGYRDGLIAIAPGPHRIRISRSGCLAAYHTVDVPKAGGRLRTHLVCPTPD